MDFYVDDVSCSYEAVSYTHLDVYKRQAQGKVYEVLSGCYPKPKGLLFPWILSIQNLTGVYSPFTVEANYNTEMPAYNIPFTACHEPVSYTHLASYCNLLAGCMEKTSKKSNCCFLYDFIAGMCPFYHTWSNDQWRGICLNQCSYEEMCIRDSLYTSQEESDRTSLCDSHPAQGPAHLKTDMEH